MCHFASHPLCACRYQAEPRFGSVAGDITVTITGSGFGSSGNPQVKAVQVGSAQATGVIVDSNTQLTVTLPAAIATVPPGSPNPTQDGAGPANIVVTNNNGQSSGISAVLDVRVRGRKLGSPTICRAVTGVSPYGGLDTSPATVTIFGSGFVSPGSSTSSSSARWPPVLSLTSRRTS